jgi:UTP--glucose-1-phosphate uridylyltransferase
MLPLFAASRNGVPVLKPLLQLVFEQLYDVGIRDFCFIVGRGKRVIEDHFTPDQGYLADLGNQGKDSLVSELASFYERLDDANLVWINQPRPLGFGDAVKRAAKAVGDEDLLVHAGDTYILSEDNIHLKTLMDIFAQRKPESLFVVKNMKDVRQRGIIQGKEISSRTYAVTRLAEKPKHPFSNLAIEPLYLFRESIFDALQMTTPDRGGEIQLTDAIQMLVSSGKEVLAWEIDEKILRLDIGNPDSYWEALSLSHDYVVHSTKTNLKV